MFNKSEMNLRFVGTTGISRPHLTYSEESFALVGFNIVGGYAVQPRWRDGHGTGIYSFQYLRRLAEATT